MHLKLGKGSLAILVQMMGQPLMGPLIKWQSCSVQSTQSACTNHIPVLQVGLIRVLDQFVTEDSELWLFSDVPLSLRRNLLKSVSVEPGV